MSRDPRGWAADELSEFLDLAHKNCLGAFVAFKPQYVRLQEVDAAFRRLLGNLDNLRKPVEVVAAFLAYRAHANFLGCCRLALSAQAYESFVLGRSCLESGLYCLFVAKTPDAASLWLDRHESEESLSQMKAQFTIGATKKLLAEVDPRWSSAVSQLYDVSIELGGHPNPRGVLGTSSISSDGVTVTLGTDYLAAPDSPAFHAALVNAARIGIASLGTVRHAFPERFEILGLREELQRLSQYL